MADSSRAEYSFNTERIFRAKYIANAESEYPICFGTSTGAEHRFTHPW